MPVYEPMCVSWTQRPFQGQCPEAANVFLFGKDANYDSNTPADFLRVLKQYHEDGVAYWLNSCQNNNNDHHPFLLPSFGEGAGYKYHSTFRMIDLRGNKCAKAISFVELLNVPTADIISDQEFERLLGESIQDGHLARLQNSMLNGRNKLVFMPNEVIKNLKKINERHGYFSELDYTYKSARGLPDIYTNRERNIIVKKYIHLSAHRFHHKEILEQLPQMKQIILDFLNNLEADENRTCRQQNRGDRE